MNLRQRRGCQKRIKASANLVYNHRAAIHYSQGPHRFDGPTHNRRAYRGEYPTQTDCSGMASWMLWDATRWLRLGDFVNGLSWHYGYTGTMVNHGRELRWWEPLRVGDLVFYGGTRSVPGHVTVYIGNGLCLSHGSEAGPMFLSVNYRPPIMRRRYL